MIPSKTLEYWGFKQHPFADNILRGDLLKLFVDRETELGDVEDALGHSRVVGVFGGLGVGKSSFLHKLKQELNRAEFPVAYVQLTADSETTLYREILTELLLLQLDGSLQLKRTRGFNAKDEAQRMAATIQKSRGSTFGGKFMGLLGGELKEEKRTLIGAHDENSACQVLRKIFVATKTPLIIVLDDFEKLSYHQTNHRTSYLPVLSRFVNTLEESLNHPSVSFVVSMDSQIERLLDRSSRNGEAFAFSLNCLVKLSNLRLSDLQEFLRVRLETHGWKKGLAAFISNEAFLALALASGSNPRWVVRILAEAMKLVAAAPANGPKLIDHPTVSAACKNVGKPLDARNWTVVSHLLKHGQGSASDERLREALNYRKSKQGDGYHASVHRRLKKVAKTFRIDFEESRSGSPPQKILRIPALDWSGKWSGES